MNTSGVALVPRLRRALSPAAERALRAAILEAKELGIPLYVVGGAVRDLIVAAAHVDLDLVVEGDALALAERIGNRLRAQVVLHPRFGTAAISGVNFRLDIAAARAERYPRPGALPIVRQATLSDDLARRDFSINAIALPLAPRAGELIDPHGGRADVERCLVRVLHERSFQDDATRILRAIRYAGRFRFKIEPKTARWLRRDRMFLETISGARLRREIELFAKEDCVTEVVLHAERLGVWRAIDPALRAPAPAALGRLRKVPPTQRDAVLIALLLARAPAATHERAVARLSLTRRQQDAVAGLRALTGKRRVLSKRGLQPSAATKVLSVVSSVAIEAFAALEGRTVAGRRARRYLDEWRFARPRMNGHELIKMGVAAGPRVGEILLALRDARLDGALKTKRDETVFVRARLDRRHARARR